MLPYKVSRSLSIFTDNIEDHNSISGQNIVQLDNVLGQSRPFIRKQGGFQIE